MSESGAVGRERGVEVSDGVGKSERVGESTRQYRTMLKMVSVGGSERMRVLI